LSSIASEGGMSRKVIFKGILIGLPPGLLLRIYAINKRARGVPQRNYFCGKQYTNQR
jgi:hypothetical protein